MEAEAAEWSIQIAKEASLQSIILETDSQVVANLVNNKEGNITDIYWIISKIQALKKDFRCLEAKYVRISGVLKLSMYLNLLTLVSISS